MSSNDTATATSYKTDDNGTFTSIVVWVPVGSGVRRVIVTADTAYTPRPFASGRYNDPAFRDFTFSAHTRSFATRAEAEAVARTF